MLVKFRLTQGKHYARADGRSVIVYVDHGTKKKTTGSYCLVPCDVIECDAEKLKHFMDKFEKISPDPPPPQPTAGLILDPLENGKFNVVNSKTGKALNDEPLSRDVAESIIADHAAKGEEKKK